MWLLLFYHWMCEKVQLTHLCFADDLMLFCYADFNSVAILRNALNEFSSVSGLIPNMNKSTSFFGNVKSSVKSAISSIMPFEVGTLPVKYLGVPLISTRLHKHHCSSLVDKVKKRLHIGRINRAGRLELIKSMICSIYVYCSSV